MTYESYISLFGKEIPGTNRALKAGTRHVLAYGDEKIAAFGIEPVATKILHINRDGHRAIVTDSKKYTSKIYSSRNPERFNNERYSRPITLFVKKHFRDR